VEVASGRVTQPNGPNGWGPAWSPDGKRLAFSRSAGDFAQIVVINADGSGLASLTADSFTSRSPTWSPDGRRIAYVSIESTMPETSRVCVINAHGGDPACLAQGYSLSGASSIELAWRP
jgi:Tol biopolymer transport system component